MTLEKQNTGSEIHHKHMKNSHPFTECCFGIFMVLSWLFCFVALFFTQKAFIHPIDLMNSIDLSYRNSSQADIWSVIKYLASSKHMNIPRGWESWLV